MSLEKWNDTTHRELLAGWLKARGVEAAFDWRTVPPSGFVADNCYAGFLYLTNSSTAYLDSFVSDPAAPKAQRLQASTELMGKLLELAKQHRVTHVCGATASRHIASLVSSCGFKEEPGRFHYFSREI